MTLPMRLLVGPCLLASAVACAAQGPLSPSQVAGDVAPSHPAPVLQAYPVQGPLADRIAAIVQAPAVARAHWGVAVTAMDGMPIYGYNEAQFFRPASNAKLFTTAAAMALLPAGTTFKTRVSGTLERRTGTLRNLHLVGGGDANFGTENLPYAAPSQQGRGAVPAQPALADLAGLADQLVANGVKRVQGDVVGDDTLFPFEPYADSWDSGDAVWGYGAPVSALSIADNQLRLTVSPRTGAGAAPKGFPSHATATLEDHGVPFYTVRSEVSGLGAGIRSEVSVERLAGSRELRAYGFLATDAPPDVEQVAISDPALYAAMAFRSMLIARGIAVSGDAVASHQPLRLAYPGPLPGPQPAKSREQAFVEDGTNGGSCMAVHGEDETLAEHVSAPLAADVLFTNKTSANLHAELLLHHLGRAIFCSDGSSKAGVRLERAWLEHVGLDPADFVFYDGSGLSSHDLVTPRATAKLLAYASTQAWFAAWKASLPVGGVDGTLRTRFAGKSALKGHVFAKTGTLGESRALSGYVNCASGRTVVFSIFVDNHTPANASDREAMDAIVEAIAAAN